MRALTLWAEWAWGVGYLNKDIENRGKPPPGALLGKWIGIHGGASIGGIPLRADSIFNHNHIAALNEMLRTAQAAGADVPLQMLVGAGQLRCQRILREGTGLVCFVKLKGVLQPRAERDRWHMPNQFGLVLEDVQRLTKPVPCKGMLGYWNLPREVIAAAAQALPAGRPSSLVHEMQRAYAVGAVR
jgi:hypothetical protein